MYWQQSIQKPMQQWYDCPQYRQLVQYGQSNCLSCGIQLNWPAPQKSQPSPQYQQQSSWSQQQEDTKGFDWRKSKAHLLLLSKFIHANCFEDFARHDYWKDCWNNILGESSKQAIKRFVDQGMLITATDLNDLLTYKYKVTELKDMLKQRSLPVSGRKDEKIQRLIQADPNGMKKAVADLSLLQCTQSGYKIAEQYLVAEQEHRNRVECEVMEYIIKRKFREASLTVAAFEQKQLFPRGIGIDWKQYNPDRHIEILKTIFESKPKIIAQLENEKTEALRLGAAMTALWGTNMAKKWLPANFETGMSFDNDTAARMFLFPALRRAALEDYRKSGLQYVQILTTPESCNSCKKLEGKRYILSNVPELPNPNCTDEMGCRCVYAPCVD